MSLRLCGSDLVVSIRAVVGPRPAQPSLVGWIRCRFACNINGKIATAAPGAAPHAGGIMPPRLHQHFRAQLRAFLAAGELAKPMLICLGAGKHRA